MDMWPVESKFFEMEGISTASGLKGCIRPFYLIKNYKNLTREIH
jgi:hypothetical protein